MLIFGNRSLCHFIQTIQPYSDVDPSGYPQYSYLLNDVADRDSRHLSVKISSHEYHRSSRGQNTKFVNQPAHRQYFYADLSSQPLHPHEKYLNPLSIGSLLSLKQFSPAVKRAIFTDSKLNRKYNSDTKQSPVSNIPT